MMPILSFYDVALRKTGQYLIYSFCYATLLSTVIIPATHAEPSFHTSSNSSKNIFLENVYKAFKHNATSKNTTIINDQPVQSIIGLKKPEDPDAKFKTAQHLLYEHKPRLTLEIITPLLHAYPDNVDYLLLEASAHLQLKEHSIPDIRKSLQRAITLAPDYADLYKVFLRTCHPVWDSECKALQMKAETRFPNTFWWYRPVPEKTASGELNQHWLDSDILAIQHYLAQHPQNDDAKLLLAKRMVWKKEFKKASTLFGDILLSQPANTAFLEGKSWALTIEAGHAYQKKAFKTARNLLKQAIDITPEREATGRLLALTCQQINDTNCKTDLNLIDRQFSSPYWAVTYQAVFDTSGKLDKKWYLDRINRLNKALIKSPNTVEALEIRARLLSWGNKNKEALQDYQQLEMLSPNNQDYIISKARILNKLSQPEKAESLLLPFIQQPLFKPEPISLHSHSEAFNRPPTTEEDIVLLNHAGGIDSSLPSENLIETNSARDTANDFSDPLMSIKGYKALIESQLLQHHWTDAKETIALASQHYPGIDWRTFQSAIPKTAHRLLAQYGYEDLSGVGLQSWQESLMQYDVKYANQTGLTLGLLYNRRFSENDFGYLLGGTFPLSRHVNNLTTVAFRPNQKILPGFLLNESLYIKMPLGFDAVMGYRFQQYGKQQVHTVLPSLGKSWHQYHLAYTLFNNHIDRAGNNNSHLFDLSRSYNTSNRLGIRFSFGEGLENIPQRGGLLRYNTTGYQIYGEHFFKPQWAVSYTLGYTQLERLFNLKGFQVGIKRIF